MVRPSIDLEFSQLYTTPCVERDAMGDDEYHPLTKRGSNLTEVGGIGYMVVDVIDTLQLMDLQDEYSRARQWISDNLSFERDGAFSVFEVLPTNETPLSC